MGVSKFVVDWFIPIGILLYAVHIYQSTVRPLGAILALLVIIGFLIYQFLKAPFH